MTSKHYRPRHAKRRVPIWGRIACWFGGTESARDTEAVEWLASMRVESIFDSSFDACWASAQATAVTRLITIAEWQAEPLRVPPYLWAGVSQ
jgi:hypothetical protein